MKIHLKLLVLFTLMLSVLAGCDRTGGFEATLYDVGISEIHGRFDVTQQIKGNTKTYQFISSADNVVEWLLECDSYGAPDLMDKNDAFSRPANRIKPSDQACREEIYSDLRYKGSSLLISEVVRIERRLYSVDVRCEDASKDSSMTILKVTVRIRT